MSRDILLFVAVFVACAVEAVEAMTIVLAAGLTRGWRSALAGASAALVVLAAIVATLGPALTVLPIDILRLVVGGLLLVFGLQWLRKAILRASGFKAQHDEDAIFAAELSAARAAGREPRVIDGYGFTLGFKGVLLEGLEVAFIAVTFGSNQHNVALAAVAAAAAVVLVAAAGVAVRAPLSQVPENTLKFGVGVMLTAFGTFWGAEGAGARWPGGDAAILALIVFTLATSFLLVGALRRRHARRPVPVRRAGTHNVMGRLRAFGAFLYDFVIGDDPLIAAVVVVALGLTATLASADTSAWWMLPVAVVAVLSFSLHRATRH